MANIPLLNVGNAGPYSLGAVKLGCDEVDFLFLTSTLWLPFLKEFFFILYITLILLERQVYSLLLMKLSFISNQRYISLLTAIKKEMFNSFFRNPLQFLQFNLSSFPFL